ncbi:hypothetical protein CR513_01251, partial [Mucuna pruriens]
MAQKAWSLSSSRIAIASNKAINEGFTSFRKSSSYCQARQFGKQHRQPFPKTAWRAIPQRTHTLKGSLYYIVFIDDFTIFCWKWMECFGSSRKWWKTKVAATFKFYRCKHRTLAYYSLHSTTKWKHMGNGKMHAMRRIYQSNYGLRQKIQHYLEQASYKGSEESNMIWSMEQRNEDWQNEIVDDVYQR